MKALDHIIVAFSSTSPPGSDEIPSRRQGRVVLEARMVQKYFAAKRWQDITPEWLQAYPGDEKACLQFMSHRAFCYYYPAFMTLCLVDATDRAELLDRVVEFADRSDRNHERFDYMKSAYDQMQRAAVRMFLREVNERFVRLQLGERTPELICRQYWTG